MTDQPDLAARLDALEHRLQLAEDKLAITQLIASYGPLVDAGRADEVGQLWTEDGEYDVEGWSMRSRADIHAMVLSDAHQRLITNGSVHFLGPVWVEVAGDEAKAVCDSLLVLNGEEGWRVARGSVHRFQLVRDGGAWRIKHRISRQLDGSQSSRDLLPL